MRIFITILFLCCTLGIFADDIMRKTSDNTYIVNTKTLCKAKGYRSATPVEVYIKNDVVTKVETLKNTETRSFFERVKQHLLPLYNNVKVSKAVKLTSQKKVDGCTGATISTTAVQQNVRAALEYYKKNK